MIYAPFSCLLEIQRDTMKILFGILHSTHEKQDQYEAYKKAYRVTLELNHKDPLA